MSTELTPADPCATEFLDRAEIEVEGRLVDASNATLYCGLSADGVQAHCVYKPISGERPLWDFPDGHLAWRELATYLVSEAAGFHVVPPTVLREGPFGPGMVQLWVDTDEESELVDITAPDEVPEGWRPILRAEDGAGNPAVLAHADVPELRAMAALDVVVNNTDRKGGHVLNTAAGVFGVDHGICLHQEDKLRTILWGFMDEPLGDRVRAGLERLSRELDGELGSTLAGYLTAEELHALRTRTRLLRAADTYPEPGNQWRAIPWPVF
ncbi:SCO1664 family protein [Sciscionella sediminilitoris]|uniref:SCO1664 family protein n=1 Tax=Sciscionella sediminilitoris TaxID=1445613 RepID=UPI0004DF0DDA|nr:SCO1664 family protein [Sciscionella sp. SE31]